MNNLKNKIKKLLHILSVMYIERRKGLNFTTLDIYFTGIKPILSLQKSEGEWVDSIFEHLTIKSTDSLIDIGCSKGFVLSKVYHLGFARLTGIDSNNRVIKIACKNMKRLKINKVTFEHIDARDFEHYTYYNYFYLFNPFPLKIFSVVIDKIVETLISNPRKITIIYVNPHYSDYIVKSGKDKEVYLVLKHKIYNNYTGKYDHIYENEE